LEEALEKLKGVVDRKVYTIDEMKTIRRILLSTVRNEIDVYACGHMPNKRYY
jgi:hypothetical protein